MGEWEVATDSGDFKAEPLDLSEFKVKPKEKNALLEKAKKSYRIVSDENIHNALENFAYPVTTPMGENLIGQAQGAVGAMGGFVGGLREGLSSLAEDLVSGDLVTQPRNAIAKFGRRYSKEKERFGRAVSEAWEPKNELAKRSLEYTGKAMEIPGKIVKPVLNTAGEMLNIPKEAMEAINDAGELVAIGGVFKYAGKGYVKTKQGIRQVAEKGNLVGPAGREGTAFTQQEVTDLRTIRKSEKAARKQAAINKKRQKATVQADETINKAAEKAEPYKPEETTGTAEEWTPEAFDFQPKTEIENPAASLFGQLKDKVPTWDAEHLEKLSSLSPANLTAEDKLFLKRMNDKLNGIEPETNEAGLIKGETYAGGRTEITPKSESERLGIDFEATVEGKGGRRTIDYYYDPHTGTRFYTKVGESLDDALIRVRKGKAKSPEIDKLNERVNNIGKRVVDYTDKLNAELAKPKELQDKKYIEGLLERLDRDSRIHNETIGLVDAERTKLAKEMASKRTKAAEEAMKSENPDELLEGEAMSEQMPERSKIDPQGGGPIEVEAFRGSSAKGEGTKLGAEYWTDHEQTAQNYASGVPEGQLRKENLKLNNPLDLRSLDAESARLLEEKLPEEATALRAEMKRTQMYGESGTVPGLTEGDVAWLRSQGHDSVVTKSVAGNGASDYMVLPKSNEMIHPESPVQRVPALRIDGKVYVGDMPDGTTHSLLYKELGRDAFKGAKKVESGWANPDGSGFDRKMVDIQGPRMQVEAQVQAALELKPISAEESAKSKVAAKNTIKEGLASGEIEEGTPVRSTGVAELSTVVNNEALWVGKDFEGLPGISAQAVGKDTPMVAYGPSTQRSVMMIFEKGAVESKGEQPHEVKIKPNTPVSSVRFVVGGINKIFNFDQIKEFTRKMMGSEGGFVNLDLLMPFGGGKGKEGKIEVRLGHPLSSYVGNKVSMLRTGAYDGIKRIVGNYQRVVEPFGGTGIVGSFLTKGSNAKLVLNDLNKNLVNFHNTVRESPHSVTNEINRIGEQFNKIRDKYPEGGEQAHKEVTNLWNTLRDRMNSPKTDEVRKAAIFSVMNSSRSGFGGVMPSQKLIQGKDAATPYTWRNFDISKIGPEVIEHSKQHSGTRVTNLDAEQIIKNSKQGDLLIIDPPYIVDKATKKSKYYEHGQELGTNEDAVKFIDEVLGPAVKRGVDMVYTGHATPDVIEALKRNGFELEQKTVKTRMGKDIGERTEVVGKALTTTKTLEERRAAYDKVESEYAVDGIKEGDNYISPRGKVIGGEFTEDILEDLTGKSGDAADIQNKHRFVKVTAKDGEASFEGSASQAGVITDQLGKMIKDKKDKTNYVAVELTRLGEEGVETVKFFDGTPKEVFRDLKEWQSLEGAKHSESTLFSDPFGVGAATQLMSGGGKWVKAFVKDLRDMGMIVDTWTRQNYGDRLPDFQRGGIPEESPELLEGAKDINQWARYLSPHFTFNKVFSLWNRPEIDMQKAHMAWIQNVRNSMAYVNDALKDIPNAYPLILETVKPLFEKHRALMDEFSNLQTKRRSLQHKLSKIPESSKYNRLQRQNAKLATARAKVQEKIEAHDTPEARDKFFLMKESRLRKIEERIEKLKRESSKEQLKGFTRAMEKVKEHTFEAEGKRLMAQANRIDKAITKRAEKMRDIENTWQRVKDYTKLKSQIRDLDIKIKDLYPKFKKMGEEFDPMLMELADKHADVRVYLKASGEAPVVLRSAAEQRAADQLRKYMEDRRDKFEEVGIPVIKEKAYMTHLWRPLLEDESMLQIFNKYREKPTLLTFMSRLPGSRPWIPSAQETMRAYVPSAEYKLAYQPFLNRWRSFVDSSKEPRLHKFMDDWIESNMSRQDFTVPEQIINTAVAFEYVRTIGLSLSVAVKHGMKIMGTPAEYGFINSLKAIPQVAVVPYQATMEFGQIKFPKFAEWCKDNGIAQEHEQLLLFRHYIAQSDLVRMMTEIPQIERLDRGLFSPQTWKTGSVVMDVANKAFGKIMAQPVKTVETLENGVSVMAGAIAGKTKGIDPRIIERRIWEAIFDVNFRAGVDQPLVQRQRPGVRAMSMFQTTPLKLQERLFKWVHDSISWRKNPDTGEWEIGKRDAFGTHGGAKLCRFLLMVGMAETIARQNDTSVLGVSMAHLPFVGEVIEPTKHGYEVRGIPSMIAEPLGIESPPLKPATASPVFQYLNQINRLGIEKGTKEHLKEGFNFWSKLKKASTEEYPTKYDNALKYMMGLPRLVGENDLEVVKQKAKDRNQEASEKIKDWGARYARGNEEEKAKAVSEYIEWTGTLKDVVDEKLEAHDKNFERQILIHTATSHRWWEDLLRLSPEDQAKVFWGKYKDLKEEEKVKFLESAERFEALNSDRFNEAIGKEMAEQDEVK